MGKIVGAIGQSAVHIKNPVSDLLHPNETFYWNGGSGNHNQLGQVITHPKIKLIQINFGGGDYASFKNNIPGDLNGTRKQEIG